MELSHPLLLDLREESEMNIPFTYSVTWEQTELAFDNRFDRYLDSKFFEHKVSCVWVLLNDDVRLNLVIICFSSVMSPSSIPL